MARILSALVALFGFGMAAPALAQAAQCATDGGCSASIVINLPCANCCPLPQPPTDGGSLPPDAGTPPTDGGTMPPSALALHTQGNAILRADGSRWRGVGVNLMDTRSCNACAYQSANVEEVKRRADFALNAGATFIRLDSESYATLDGRTHGLPPDQDAAYLADLKDIVAHIVQRSEAQVLLSLWSHPSIGSEGRPTAATVAAWQHLAHEFRNQPGVWFGIVNEPENNYDGSGDSAVWNLMNDVVQAIRATEDADGVPHHIVAVQGTGGWARLLQYYIAHPIPSDNIVYETHVYNPQADFQKLVTTPAETLPVVIGEFGPYSGLMTNGDTAALMSLANSLQVPWAAWTLHMRCPPNLLVDNSAWGCGIGMTLAPTEFARQVQTYFLPTRRVRR